jgi:cytochrome P450
MGLCSRDVAEYPDLVAGTETSAVTMSWVGHRKTWLMGQWFKYMTNNPAIQIKLRQHLLERLPQPVTADSLSPSNVPYLEAVVQETLRLSRTAGGISREGQYCVIWS